MQVRLAAAIVGAALSVAAAQGQQPDGAQTLEPSRAASAAGAETDVGFGGTEEPVAQATSSDSAEDVQQLQERVRELEQTVTQQGTALAETGQQLQQLQERLQQQEALSATVEQRTIATEQQERVTQTGQRAVAVQSALEDIAILQETVQAGSDDVAARLSSAIAQLESAASEAGRWGSTAEADQLTEAALLLRPIPQMLAGRNFQNASVALYAAQRRATTAQILARSVVVSR